MNIFYRHFGKDIISHQLEIPSNHAQIPLLYEKIYTEMIEAIDGNDNGQSAYPDDTPAAYSTKAITLPGMVASLNPAWNDESNDAILDSQFEKASQLMGGVFVDLVKYYGKSWLPARDIVKASIEKATEYDPEGRIVVFDDYTAWKDHLFKLEEELGISGRTYYALYSDGKGWRVQAVPVSPDSFTSRKALPEPWRGIRDQALSELTGIDGGVFVHAAGKFWLV